MLDKSDVMQMQHIVSLDVSVFSVLKLSRQEEALMLEAYFDIPVIPINITNLSLRQHRSSNHSILYPVEAS